MREKKRSTECLQNDTYKSYLAKGIFTDAARRYPRYVLKSITEFSSLDTECGKRKEQVDLQSLKAEAKGSIESENLLIWLTRISGLFNLKLELSGQMDIENSKSVKSEYGDQHGAFVFQKLDLDVVDPEFQRDPPEPSRTYFITVEQVCAGVGSEVGGPIYVNAVHVKDQDGVIRARHFGKFYPKLAASGDKIPESVDEDGPQMKVYQKSGGHPYLTIINSRSDYTRIFRLWQEQFEDASLAAIFMSLFNSSCPDKKVSGQNLRQECNKILSP